MSATIIYHSFDVKRTLARHFTALLIGAMLCSSLMAAEPIDSPDSSETTIEPFRSQATLAAKGIDLHAYYTFDYSKVVDGGVRTGEAARGTLDLELSLDLTKLLHWRDGTVYVLFEKFGGDKGFQDTGDYQFYSNNDAVANYEGYYEVWLERAFYNDRLRLKVGKIDVGTEFAYADNGADFLNYSMTVSPTLYPMIPVVPFTATGANVHIYPRTNVYLGMGLYDGAFLLEGVNTGTHGPESFWDDPADLFIISELGLSWPGENNDREGRLGLGLWRHTGDFTRFDGTNDSGASGFYLVADQTLWKENTAGDEQQFLTSFAQYGYADPNISTAHHHLGGGLVWHRPFNLRPADAVGLGATWVRFSDMAGAGFTEHSECALELYYKLTVNDHLVLKPDVQRIMQPNGDRTLDDATVATLRVELSF